MSNMLNVTNLYFSYNNNTIFNEFTFSITEGSINAIIGPNKCGRTTLIKILSGILRSDGNINLNGILLNEKNIKNYSRNIGVCFFNNINKFLFDDVLSEIIFSLENLCLSDKEIDCRLSDVLKLLDMEYLIHKNIKDLTSIEKVKVILASNIIHEPKILLLDDLFEELNYIEMQSIYKLLKKIVTIKRITILFTTRKLEHCLNSDNLLVISDGKIILEGMPEEVIEHDNTLVKVGIDIPIMIDLSLKLKFYNLIDEIITDVDGMVDELWK